ncbi:MAG: group I intron-associated PD-(D/E)XK endonuclease [Candidatus Sulfotelmatobacter sp.]
MKNRKNLGCRIKDPKQRGVWAELYFMALAAGQGLKVSSPYGGFSSYDVGVEDTGPILRVQVKCTLYSHARGGYRITVMGPKHGAKRHGYEPGTVDFFALYIIPLDDWYIIPYAVIGRRNKALYFNLDKKRRKHGKYREAWHLLLEACKGRAEGPVEIRACCEEGDAAERARELTRGSALRKMFRGVFRG